MKEEFQFSEFAMCEVATIELNENFLPVGYSLKRRYGLLPTTNELISSVRSKNVIFQK